MRSELLARQFACFAGVGALGTAVHYITLIALVQTSATQPLAASAAGFILGALTNYFLNRQFTFRSRKRHREAMGKFFGVALIGLALNSMILALAIESLGLHYLAAQVIATGLVLAWNFTANRLWTFKESVSGADS